MTVSFDWRGRTNTNARITLSNGSVSHLIDVTGGGDVTVNSMVIADSVVSPIINSSPDTTGDIASSTVVTGTTEIETPPYPAPSPSPSPRQEP